MRILVCADPQAAAASKKTPAKKAPAKKAGKGPVRPTSGPVRPTGAASD